MGKEDSGSMVTGIEGSDDRASITTSCSTVAKAAWWQVISNFGSSASVEFSVGEEQ